MWTLKSVSQPLFTQKTLPTEIFTAKSFPINYRLEITSWTALSENVLSERRVGFHDDFSTNTLGNYVLTQDNGFIIIDGGFLKSNPGDLTRVGTTRIATRQEFSLTREHSARASFFLDTWHRFSDVAVGFSTEKILGNTAYRGDIALWLDNQTLKLFYRQTRTSPINEINLGSLVASSTDRITFSLTQNGNATRCQVWRNDVIHLDQTRTTFNYGNMYAMIGVRDGIESTTTSIWVDWFLVHSDITGQSIVSQSDLPRSSIWNIQRELPVFSQRTIPSVAWGMKQLSSPVWDRKIT